MSRTLHDCFLSDGRTVLGGWILLTSRSVLAGAASSHRGRPTAVLSAELAHTAQQSPTGKAVEHGQHQNRGNHEQQADWKPYANKCLVTTRDTMLRKSLWTAYSYSVADLGGGGMGGGGVADASPLRDSTPCRPNAQTLVSTQANTILTNQNRDKELIDN